MVLQDCILGMKFSGVDTKTNQCIMGLLPVKGLATTVHAGKFHDQGDAEWIVIRGS
jgi:hypothetical protein